MNRIRPGTVLKQKINERRGLLVAGAANALAARVVEERQQMLDAAKFKALERKYTA